MSGIVSFAFWFGFPKDNELTTKSMVICNVTLMSNFLALFWTCPRLLACYFWRLYNSLLFQLLQALKSSLVQRIKSRTLAKVHGRSSFKIWISWEVVGSWCSRLWWGVVRDRRHLYTESHSNSNLTWSIEFCGVLFATVLQRILLLRNMRRKQHRLFNCNNCRRCSFTLTNTNIVNNRMESNFQTKSFTKFSS